MLRVIVRQARPGMVLSRSIANPRQPEETLLSPGHELGVANIAQLHEQGVYDLWVEYPALDFLNEVYSPELSTPQQRLCEMLQNCFLEQTQRSGAGFVEGPGRATVEELIRAAMETARTVPAMWALASHEEMLLRHGCEVCALSMALGLRLESYVKDQRKVSPSKGAVEVVKLGLGCLLHDVGELQMKPEMRESLHPLAFDEEAEDAWRGHVEAGFGAVRGQLEPSAATVVLHHHQHFDGSGFPRVGGAAQSGTQIHVFSRIALVADTFQHLLRRDGIAGPTVMALWEMQQNPMRKWFDPVVLSALMEVAPPFLPGMLVTLSDRRQAVVTRTHEDCPCYPEVQVLSEWDAAGEMASGAAREVVDLAVTPEFYVAEVDGFEVGRYLFGGRKAEGVGYGVGRVEEVGAVAAG